MLDTSAVLALIEDEAGADRVETLFESAQAIVPWPVLMETYYITQRALGQAEANGVEFLLTWNYKHLANALMREKIATTCREAGYVPVIICTPEELMEV